METIVETGLEQDLDPPNILQSIPEEKILLKNVASKLEQRSRKFWFLTGLALSAVVAILLSLTITLVGDRHPSAEYHLPYLGH